MSIEIYQTPRGFYRGDFIDIYGAKCSIQDSSLATQDALWLGMDEGTHHLDVCVARMHLSQELAKELIPLLQRFVLTGSIKPYEQGDQIMYVPDHVMENTPEDMWPHTPGVEFGFIESEPVNNHVRCRYWRMETVQGVTTISNELRTKANGEMTPIANIRRYVVYPQPFIQQTLDDLAGE